MTTTNITADIAIVGAGFSGLMTLYHLVQDTSCPRSIAIIDPDAFGRGLAYSTTNIHHLLNVRAKGMSALPDQPTHFLDWLNSSAGHAQAQSLGIAQTQWQADDFAPRALYARYLDDFRTALLHTANVRGITIHDMRASVTAITKNDGSFDLKLTNDTSLSAKRALLALGNLPQTTPAAGPRIINRVWDFDFTQTAATTGNIAIIGAGLTMVDIVIALRDAGYRGHIDAISRNGWLPHTHDMRDAQLQTQASDLAKSPQRLRTLFRALRREVRGARRADVSWQTAMDHWRPYLPTLWSGMPADDRRSFLEKYFTLWGIHRHRMAPAIGARVTAECAAKTLRILAGGARIVASDENSATLKLNDGEHSYAWVFDCRGPGYNLLTSDNVLLKQMAKVGLLTPDASGWGVAVEDDLKVNGQEGLYAIGPMAIGARLETTAVPELRGQAQAVAKTLLESM